MVLTTVPTYLRTYWLPLSVVSSHCRNSFSHASRSVLILLPCPRAVSHGFFICLSCLLQHLCVCVCVCLADQGLYHRSCSGVSCALADHSEVMRQPTSGTPIYQQRFHTPALVPRHPSHRQPRIASGGRKGIMNPTVTRDLYRTLGLRQGADQTAIRTAYQHLVRLRHPDRNPQSPTATEDFQNVRVLRG